MWWLSVKCWWHNNFLYDHKLPGRSSIETIWTAFTRAKKLTNVLPHGFRVTPVSSAKLIQGPFIHSPLVPIVAQQRLFSQRNATRSRNPAQVPSPGSQHFFFPYKICAKNLKSSSGRWRRHFCFWFRSPSPKPFESIDAIEFLYSRTTLIHYAARREHNRHQPQWRRSRRALPLSTTFFSPGTLQQPLIIPEESLFGMAIVQTTITWPSMSTLTPQFFVVSHSIVL